MSRNSQNRIHVLPLVPDSCNSLKTAAEKGEIQLHTFARGTYPGVRIPGDILKGIKSIGFWDAQNEQNWGLPFHRNEGIEIAFLETGILNFEVRNEKFGLYPGAITFTRPWIEHKLGSPLISPSKLHWLILDVGVSAPHQNWKWPDWIILTAQDLEMLTIFLRQTEKFVSRGNKAIGDAFIQIGHIALDENVVQKESELRLLINIILINLLEIFKKGTFPLDETLIEAKRTVEYFIEDLNNSYHHPWTLDLMARYCHLGKTRFSTFFKELTNLSPIEYLNRLRIAKSMELLRNNNVPVTEIAYTSGFSSVQYFSNVFRKINGVSPRNFQYKLTNPILPET
jgi:AraC family L-rhamnose operon regulatory protein RhaS